MTQLPRRRATTIVLLLLISGSGGAFYSHSTASEQPGRSARRTAAGLRGEQPRPVPHPTADAAAQPVQPAPVEPSAVEPSVVERAVVADDAVERAEPSVSQAAARDQFNRTVFGPKPKAAPRRATPPDAFVPAASNPIRRDAEPLPTVLPVAEPKQLAPLKVALQPKPMPPQSPPAPPAPKIETLTQPEAAQEPRIIPAPQADELPSGPSNKKGLPPFQPLEFQSIRKATTSIVPEGTDMPHNFAAFAQPGPPQELALPGEPPRTSAPFYSTPRVADFTHRPLYFEEKALERNGRTIGLAQPLVSFVHFFGTVPALPYKMGEKPPSTPMYTGDGVNLPSDHATVRQRVRGVMSAAGTAVGLNAILP